MNDGTVMRDGAKSHVRHGQGLSSCEPSPKETSARSRPGILIFSRGRQLLHMNSRALELTGHLNQDEIGLVHILVGYDLSREGTSSSNLSTFDQTSPTF